MISMKMVVAGLIVLALCFMGLVLWLRSLRPQENGLGTVNPNPKQAEEEEEEDTSYTVTLDGANLVYIDTDGESGISNIFANSSAYATLYFSTDKSLEAAFKEIQGAMASKCVVTIQCENTDYSN